jgi:hypothetical protein
LAWVAPACAWLAAKRRLCAGELISAPENLHNDGSCIVEAPNGDLLVGWFNEAWIRQGD